jgi:hypothetical protein
VSGSRSAQLRINQDTLIELALDPDDDLGSIDVTIMGQTIGAGFDVAGRDVRQFVEEVSALHRRYEGSASLKDVWGKQFELELALTDRRFGTISVRGWFFKEARYGVEDPRPGLMVRLDNFTITQDMLPEFIRQLGGGNGQ